MLDLAAGLREEGLGVDDVERRRRVVVEFLGDDAKILLGLRHGRARDAERLLGALGVYEGLTRLDAHFVFELLSRENGLVQLRVGLVDAADRGAPIPHVPRGRQAEVRGIGLSERRAGGVRVVAYRVDGGEQKPLGEGLAALGLIDLTSEVAELESLGDGASFGRLERGLRQRRRLARERNGLERLVRGEPHRHAELPTSKHHLPPGLDGALLGLGERQGRPQEVVLGDDAVVELRLRLPLLRLELGHRSVRDLGES